MFLTGSLPMSIGSPAEAVNLGRKAVQAGDLPRAIAVYRAGLRQFPDSDDLQADLTAVRMMVPAPHPGFDGWQYHVPLRDLFVVFVALVLIAAIAAAKYFTTRPRGSGWVAGMALVLALAVTVVGWKVLADAKEEDKPFEIVRTPVILREGNGESYPSVLDTPLPPGCEVNSIHTRGEWRHVRLSNGTTGWLVDSCLLR